MTVQIDWEASYANEDEGRASVVLENPERGEDGRRYGTFVAYADHVDVETFNSSSEAVAWDWENPGCGLHEVTYSPSIILNWAGQEFHIFIRDGEIEHLSDCNCGCRS